MEVVFFPLFSFLLLNCLIHPFLNLCNVHPPNIVPKHSFNKVESYKKVLKVH